ncbi:IS6 family transposase [Streptomyces piniterrae]|uniref:IS6 family transposase n=1 Tax=Streptomyces piniterrae TaxID=2571125 RepID=A0A4U0MUF1_9ACTN|nr:DDE-type integrase/transposase/recombinase [Streptomyces piniterrae]TJZ44645.1 IS6 family transposase [Streptomyces piniterrae]
MDEVFIKVNGKMRACGGRWTEAGTSSTSSCRTSVRDTRAAKRFFRRLLKDLRYVPRVIVTDKFRSYGAAHRTVMPSVEHRSSKYLNNRTENSHQPTRQRERPMKNLRSMGAAQIPRGLLENLTALPGPTSTRQSHHQLDSPQTEALLAARHFPPSSPFCSARWITVRARVRRLLLPG